VEWERELVRKGVAVVRSYPGSHAAYVFDAPWSRALGLVEEANNTGMGPYPRYGRVVRSQGDLGPLGAADVAGAQTRSILAELGYRDDEIEQLHTDAIVATPS
jgi:crotonobetainyl-CoA:carnitine CoA-transferase CaiB-like acyl-CoA transferase